MLSLEGSKKRRFNLIPFLFSEMSIVISVLFSELSNVIGGYVEKNKPEGIVAKRFDNVPNYWKVVPIMCLIATLYLESQVVMIIPSFNGLAIMIVTTSIALFWNIIELAEFRQIEVKDVTQIRTKPIA